MPGTLCRVQQVLVRGVPASHARTLSSRAGRLLLLNAAGAALVLASLYLTFRSSPERFPALVVLAVPFLALALYGFRRYQGDYARAVTGARAEESVARLLAGCGAQVLLNGVMLGSGDIDHVVMGPVAAAIETKYGRGRIIMDRKGRLVVGSRTLPKDPVAQAERNAAMLSKRLGVRFTPIVVVSDGDGPVFSAGGVFVTGSKDLLALLRTLPQVMPAVSRTARDLPVALEAS